MLHPLFPAAQCRLQAFGPRLRPATLAASAIICATVVFGRHSADAQGLVQTSGPVAPGTTYSPYEVNHLANGTSVKITSSASYFDGHQYSDSFSDSQKGTGSVTDSYHVSFDGTPVYFGDPSAYASEKTTAADTSGTLHGYSFAEAAGAGSQAFAGTDALLADTLLVSSPTTVTVSGTLEGSVYANGFASSEATLQILLLGTTPDENGDVVAYGGYTIDLTQSTFQTYTAVSVSPYGSSTPQYPFSTDVDLPAGSVYVLAELTTQSNAETYQSGSNEYDGVATTDFGHTLFFHITTPDNTSVTSETGLVPVSTVSGSAAPEPTSLFCAALAATAALLPCKRYRRQ